MGFPFGLVCALAAIAVMSPAGAETPLRVVGPASVAPLAEAVGNVFAQKYGRPAPIGDWADEASAAQRFCEKGEGAPSILFLWSFNEEWPLPCLGALATNGYQLGAESIVLMNSSDGPQLTLTRAQLFQALAESLPDPAGVLRPNPNRTWSDIDPSLPAVPIVVYGPPFGTPVMWAFIRFVMREACPKAVRESGRCDALRTDGAFVAVAEGEEGIVGHLHRDSQALGVVRFTLAESEAPSLQPVRIESEHTPAEQMMFGVYPLSWRLIGLIWLGSDAESPEIGEYLREFWDAAARAEGGYLYKLGVTARQEVPLLSQVPLCPPDCGQ